MLHEVKGKLAKLLATENLIIEHRNVETAQFDVVRRVLTLPVWKISSEDVYDLLVAHEVGHALFTDPRPWDKEDNWKNVPQNFVNITEDARIEKLIKRRYAGLSKTFYRGYSNLQDQDFFELEGEDLNKFSFADRVNLWFKIGSYIKVPVKNDREMQIINAVANAESFDDALDAARMISEYVDEFTSSETEPVTPPQSSATGSEGGEGMQSMPQQQKSPAGDSEDSGEGEDESEESESEEDTNSLDENNTAVNENETKTVDSLADKLRELADTSDNFISYVSIPNLDIEHIIVPTEEIHEYIESAWDEWKERSLEFIDRLAGIHHDNYVKFKKESAKEVNYLVKEFECKKSASAYARATTSRTGVLDCTKLHTYKYNEDLFKKVTVIPDGKNHGLVFVLDWSGSMADVMVPTIKQLYNLIWFCRKVGIPYDVFAFTNEWNYRAKEFPSIPVEEDKLYISDSFSMMNILTSKVSNAVAEQQMKNIWNIAHSFTDYSGVCPPRMYLSGTPLNEALLTLHKIIPSFKKKYGLEKVNCVILTDGEASPLSRTVMLQRNWEGEAQIRNRRCTDQTFLRNHKTGEITRLSMIYHLFTKALLDDLKSTFSEVNFVGFRIIGPGCSYNSMIYSYLPEYSDQEKARAQWRKEKSFTIKNYGYNSYIVLGNQVLSQSSEFEVSDDASKSQIKSAFRKSLANKKMNKRVLNEFIELVA
jgi:hypothetical protein